MGVDVLANLGAHRRSLPCEHCGTQGRQRHDRTCPSARKGKSARLRGNDREDYIQKRYGPSRIGHFQGPVDNVGAVFKWQSKTTRVESALDLPTWAYQTDGAGIGVIRGYRWVTDPLDHMQGIRDDLKPLLIRSWTYPGDSLDIIIVHRDHWIAEHGEAPGAYMQDPGAAFPMYVAMSGTYFLQVHGRDEE